MTAGAWRIGKAELLLALQALAGVVDGFAAQQWQQDRQVLTHVRRRALEGQAPTLLDHRLMRQPDAKHQAAADRRIHG